MARGFWQKNKSKAFNHFRSYFYLHFVHLLFFSSSLRILFFSSISFVLHFIFTWPFFLTVYFLFIAKPADRHSFHARNKKETIKANYLKSFTIIRFFAEVPVQYCLRSRPHISRKSQFPHRKLVTDSFIEIYWQFWSVNLNENSTWI